MSNVHSSDHPVLLHKLTQLRDKDTKPAEFRALLRSVTFYLGYEATKSFSTATKKISTPIGEHAGVALNQIVTLVPVMRAGLGMVSGVCVCSCVYEIYCVVELGGAYA